MKNLSKVMLIVGIVALLFGCASAPKPSGKKLYYPDWYGKTSETGDYVYAYGEAKKVNNVIAFESAKAMAFNEAAQYVENYVKAMTKDFLKESGSENPQILQLTERTVKLVSKTKFSGVIVSKRETIEDDDRYRSFVRLSIPKDEVKKTLVNTIKNEEALYNEFKATQSFNELDKEMEKYNK
ncbi:MAG: hypothetical protein U9R23_00575 [Candidatus Cloacimonadota bacterium]|nr:hypothetical protein [Candidatus Cloacimonadota bacterium]